MLGPDGRVPGVQQRSRLTFLTPGREGPRVAEFPCRSDRFLAAAFSVPWESGFPLGLSPPTHVKGRVVAGFLRGVQPLWEPVMVVLGSSAVAKRQHAPLGGRWSSDPVGPSGSRAGRPH